MSLFKGDNLINGTTVIDSALSDTSTNAVQNSVVTNALNGKLDTSGGVMTGAIDVGINPIVLGGKNLTSNTTYLTYNGSSLAYVPDFSYKNLTLLGSATGTLQLIRFGRLRILNAISVNPKSNGTAVAQLDASDRNTTSNLYGAVCAWEYSNADGHMNVEASSGNIYFYATYAAVAYSGQIVWMVNS